MKETTGSICGCIMMLLLLVIAIYMICAKTDKQTKRGFNFYINWNITVIVLAIIYCSIH